ncbi:hypothetical protein RBSH_03953 [Rhodopirellula baltica SH28]|uniref:Uncharacterized protein n=1 Tax=Rhodopirellula baltica SH28 TaxID=993517 RepID=K5CBJ3_RHOBT|nr:hypothetical protein RBSH_03953 [Rhodopirellula baltica SH28]
MKRAKSIGQAASVDIHTFELLNPQRLWVLIPAWFADRTGL